MKEDSVTPPQAGAPRNGSIAILLRCAAVAVERWSRHPHISCELSDEMEALALALREAEKECALPPEGGKDK
jgi:hypothetical protein